MRAGFFRGRLQSKALRRTVLWVCEGPVGVGGDRGFLFAIYIQAIFSPIEGPRGERVYLRIGRVVLRVFLVISLGGTLACANFSLFSVCWVIMVFICMWRWEFNISEKS